MNPASPPAPVDRPPPTESTPPHRSSSTTPSVVVGASQVTGAGGAALSRKRSGKNGAAINRIIAVCSFELEPDETIQLCCSDCAPCGCVAGQFLGIDVTGVGIRRVFVEGKNRRSKPLQVNERRCLNCGGAWQGGDHRGDRVEILSGGEA